MINHHKGPERPKNKVNATTPKIPVSEAIRIYVLWTGSYCHSAGFPPFCRSVNEYVPTPVPPNGDSKKREAASRTPESRVSLAKDVLCSSRRAERYGLKKTERKIKEIQNTIK